MNIYLTLDYELFSGIPVGTPYNSIVKPMKELDRVARKWGVKYVIFVDAAYLLQLERNSIHPSVKSDYDLLSENLQLLDNNGHDIQLHFHPQWMYSSFSEGAWKVDTKHFKLSDMEKDFAVSSFLDAKKCLEKVIGHKVNAFRAGGYCLDSFDDYISLFGKNGITIDSSVARYCHVKSDVHHYDYRNIPQKQLYPFSASVKIEDTEGPFSELSIASVRVNFMDNFTVLKKIASHYHPTIVYKDGNVLPDRKKNKLLQLKSLFPYSVRLCSFDGVSSSYLDYYYDKCLKKHYQDMVLIGHPKNATDASINNLDAFISKHINQDTFRTTKDL